MKTFNIFKPKFTWTKTKIINVSILGLVLLYMLYITVLGFSQNTFTTSLLIIAFMLFIVGLYFKIIGLGEIEQLKGTLTKGLVFDIEFIKVEEHVFNIDDIKKIEILEVDWVGMNLYNQRQGFHYENSLSNGVDNYLTIIFLDNSILKVRFQKQDEMEFQDIKEIITNYYIQGKIGYLNCVDILGIEKKSEWEAFKKLRNKE